MKTSSLMQKPIPREWLLSGFSRLRQFDPALIQKTIDSLRTDNFRMTIISQRFPGDWDQKEKWYGTEYKVGKIPEDFMRELREAEASNASNRLAALHLPHKNNFIPTKLDVEKKDIKEPAIAPAVVRNDDLVRTWWKKDDTFWVPRANLIISCKNPVLFASVENTVKTRLYADLVRDALEEFSYDAELAGLDYNVGLDSRGLCFDLSGYNDKLPVLLEQVLKTVRDLEIKDDRFDIIKERLKRGYNNWELQSSYHQIGDYLYWLNSETGFIIEEYAAELPNVTAEALRFFKPQLLGQMHIEVYVHGNMYKEDALQLTDMVQSILQPRLLPRTQWPVRRSLVLPPGSNYVYRKTLKDPANVNHCIEYWLYTGDRGDPLTRARTLFLEQVMHEPAFDQLRTKEQLGYIVFCGARVFATTYGFRWLVQSERTPQYLEARVEAFINSFGEILDKMSDADFENHKRSLVVRLLKKLENLDSESSRHWNQISAEYYNFGAGKLFAPKHTRFRVAFDVMGVNLAFACADTKPFCFFLAQENAEHVKALTKEEVVEYYKKYIDVASPTRAKLIVQLFAQGNAKSKAKIDALINTNLSGETAETKEAVRSAIMQPELRGDAAALRKYLGSDLKLAEDKIEAILAVAGDPATEPKETEEGEAVHGEEKEGDLASNGTENAAKQQPTLITDVRAFKASLVASAGARPARDITEYEEMNGKL